MPTPVRAWHEKPPREMGPSELADHLPQERRRRATPARPGVPPGRRRPSVLRRRGPGRPGGSPRCTRGRARGSRPPRPRSARAPAPGSAGPRSASSRRAAKPAHDPRGGPTEQRQDRVRNGTARGQAPHERAQVDQGRGRERARLVCARDLLHERQVHGQGPDPCHLTAEGGGAIAHALVHGAQQGSGRSRPGRANPPGLGGEQVGERVRSRSAPGGEERRQAQQGRSTRAGSPSAASPFRSSSPRARTTSADPVVSRSSDRMPTIDRSTGSTAPPFPSLRAPLAHGIRPHGDAQCPVRVGRRQCAARHRRGAPAGARASIGSTPRGVSTARATWKTDRNRGAGGGPHERRVEDRRLRLSPRR